jgi:hypothetical protein
VRTLVKDDSPKEQVEHLDQSNYIIGQKDAVLESAIMPGEEDRDKGVVRKLIRKVDLRLMPALGLLYASSLIDRVNLSVVCLNVDHDTICGLELPTSEARIAGMDAPLDLSIGNRYSIVTMMVRCQILLLDSDTDELKVVRYLHYFRFPGGISPFDGWGLLFGFHQLAC